AAVAKADTAKADSPKAAVAKADAAKTDSPKAAVAKVDAAKIDSPKVDVAKTDAAKTDSPKAAVAKADAAKVKPVVAIPKKSSKDYESKLIVLPAISVLPMKPEVMIQKKTYLTQIIALPEIAEEVGENTVQADESISSPKALEISLGNSVNAFGLPENFVSPYAVADIGKIADNKDNSVAEQTKVMPNTKKQRDILPPAASVPEIAFAEKNQDEQNAVLTEILSANKIKTSVVIEEDAVKNKNAPIVYSQVHEPEELEDVADFEMKPDFIYPDEKISALENQETIIRMQGTGWRIDAMNNYSMKLIDRRNDKNESTTFRIKNGNAGTEQITFTRYNEAENRQETQVYFVDIKPVLPRDENNTEAAPKTEKSRADDDYRKTLADRLYADENYAQASVYYKKLIDENISDNELLYKAAHSMKAIGNIDSAAEYYQRNLAEEGNPFYDDAIIEYIQLLKEQKEFDKAINEVYERGLSKSVSENCTQKLYGILGDLFFNVKNYTEAVRTYKTVLSLYPSGSGDDKALFYLAYALELQENPEFKEAQRFYRELLDVYPESQYVNLSRSRMGFIDRHYIKVN
ncbi:MAG: tetratricopeptide repeat protein, partial [Spirochaetales bacterium]|nr:tetratricopeptide repeat protein [Spirochaetales bacterium]